MSGKSSDLNNFPESKTRSYIFTAMQESPALCLKVIYLNKCLSITPALHTYYGI